MERTDSTEPPDLELQDDFEPTDPNITSLPPKSPPIPAKNPPPLSHPAEKKAPIKTAMPPAASTLPPSSVKMPELGLLDAPLRDPEVTEIMVNDTRNVMIEKNGKLALLPAKIQDLSELNRIVRNLLDASGKALTPDEPWADAVLPDGSRVHLIAPPLTQNGPCITIRKFPSQRLSLDELVKLGALDQKMAAFLNACVAGRLNLLVSGGTGSGKTTLLGALVGCIPRSERLIFIEEIPELPSQHINSVRLQSKPKSVRAPAISARDLIANALRMRPDRILVGECRRAEAFDMLQAMNTGHAGSMTTLHANSPRDALSRLETLCLLAELQLPFHALRKQIASAIDIVIQLKRARDGKRRVSAICEVTGMEGDTLTMQEIFLGDENGFRFTGITPPCVETLQDAGIEFARDFFAR